MGNIILIIIGIIMGVTATFFMSELPIEWSYLPCIVLLIILLVVGPEILPLIRKEPAVDHPWSSSRGYDNDEEAEDKP